MNHIVVSGVVCKEVEKRGYGNGGTLATFRMVNSTFRKTKDGEKKEDCFLDVTVFDVLAERCFSFLAKGTRVIVEGKLRQDCWEDKKTGEKKSKHSITAHEVHVEERKKKESSSAPANEYYPSPSPSPQYAPPMPEASYENDDIPF